jgi:outer membrane protein OmpA-like peptidoglycan-associated protein
MWSLLLASAWSAEVHLVATDAFGRVVEEARWTAEPGVLVAADMGDGVVDLVPGHYVIAATAEGFYGQVVELDVAEGRRHELQVVLDTSTVTLTERRIVIPDKVYFETGLAVIKPESFDMLREVARVVVEHPELLLLSIEGHADERGGEGFNEDLSTRRAAAVQDFLIASGVAPSRLQHRGWGETRPVVEGGDEQAWSQNRRVEFLILERAD